MKNKGASLIEVLTAIVMSSIVLMAIVGLYISSDKTFKKQRELSELIEEVRSGMTNLDFLFSRWGVGVPCKNNTCSLSNSIAACYSYPPSDPMCMDCVSGDLSTGCRDVIFYGNLNGIGFVVSVNGSYAKLISCRLKESSSSSYYYYYVWREGEVLTNSSGEPEAVTINYISPNGASCKELTEPNAETSTAIGNFTLVPGDIIIGVPKKIELFVEDGLLKEKIWDMYNPSSPQYEGEKAIAHVDSFEVYRVGRGIKVKVKFYNPKNPELTFTLERYYSR